MRTSTPLALVLLLLVLAGCSSSRKKEQEKAQAIGPAVQWTSAQPPEVADRAPAATPCRAADLTVQRQVTFVPMLQGGIALATIRNKGPRACRLTGRPRVRFVKKGGPVQEQKAAPATQSNFPEVAYPASALQALRPGESAALTITWENWCDLAVPGKPHVPPSAIRITLPDGRGNLDADYNAVPPCLDPSKPTTIGVSAFQPNLVPKAHPWSTVLLRAAIPNQPVHAKPGGILRFRLVLQNISRTTARFDRCPAYIEQLAPSGRPVVYNLNCQAAHPIKPGKSLAFAIQIHVPKTAPVGSNGLFWELDPTGADGPQVHARVIIKR